MLATAYQNPCRAKLDLQRATKGRDERHKLDIVDDGEFDPHLGGPIPSIYHGKGLGNELELCVGVLSGKMAIDRRQLNEAIEVGYRFSDRLGLPPYREV